MMPIAEFLRYFPDYEVPAAELAYATYLERRGLRFLVDFGFANAEDMAWNELENPYGFLVGHA